MVFPNLLHLLDPMLNVLDVERTRLQCRLIPAQVQPLQMVLLLLLGIIVIRLYPQLHLIYLIRPLIIIRILVLIQVKVVQRVFIIRVKSLLAHLTLPPDRLMGQVISLTPIHIHIPIRRMRCMVHHLIRDIRLKRIMVILRLI